MARPRGGGGELSPVEFTLASFAGGVNVRDAVNTLGFNELRKAENAVLDERGGAAKRLGAISVGPFGSAADRALAIYTFYRANSAPQMLLQTTAGILYYTTDATTNPIVWTSIKTGLSLTAAMSFETFNSKVYMSNGVDNYASWNGTTYTEYASAPKGKFLRLWKDTMWVSGIIATPDRVYSSNAGDPETFGVSSWIDIAKGDGDLITALATDEIFLIPFKRLRSFVMYDPVTFANRIADHEKGCEAHDSCIHFENSMYFVTRRGICQWMGDAPSQLLSGKLDPVFRPDVLNLGALANANAYHVQNRIGWALPEVGNTTPTFQIEYYPHLAQKGQPGPFMFQRVPGTVAATYRSGGVEILVVGHINANRCLVIGGGLDDGNTFQALVETGTFDLGNIAHEKYVRRMRFLGRGKFQVHLIRDFEVAIYRTHNVDLSSAQDTWNPGDTWGIGNWGPGSFVKEALVNTDVYCRFLAIRFLDAEVGTGTLPVPVGSKDYALAAGEWAIYQALVEGTVLGVRE